MATTVSLINMKGGVGKSTLTVNLAWHFAAYSQWSKRVLVVDLDPQFNSSQYLVGANRYQSFLADGKPTIWEIFEQHTRTPAGKTGPVNPSTAVRNVSRFRNDARVDLIPSRLELALSLKNPTQKETLLPKALKKLEDNYDLIFIDCAPTESILTTSAYLASNYILVPVKPEYLSTIGLPLLANSVRDFREEYEKKEAELELAGIVFNGTTDYHPEEALSKTQVKQLASKNSWYVFGSEIPYSRSYPKGAREGQPIFRTSYARSEQASRFHSFAQELAGRIGL